MLLCAPCFVLCAHGSAGLGRGRLAAGGEQLLGWARVLLLEAGPLALGMDAPHPEAHAAAEEEARHVVADEGDEVERRGERALGVLELEDHLPDEGQGWKGAG
eukprot:6980694-Prymnesium_polylepis.1